MSVELRIINGLKIGALSQVAKEMGDKIWETEKDYVSKATEFMREKGYLSPDDGIPEYTTIPQFEAHSL